LLRKADRQKGRFRNLLLTALNRYMAYVYRKSNAAKRHPAKKILSLAGIDDGVFPEPSVSATPEQAFHFVWAFDLLQEVLADVKQVCLDKKQEVYWRVFEERFLCPILTGQESLSQEKLCEQFDISDKKTVSNMAITVKRRFAAVMRKKIRQWVEDEEEIEQEICEIIKILSEGNAAKLEKNIFKNEEIL